MYRMTAETHMRRALNIARHATLREWLLFGLPCIAVIVAAYWVTFRFVQPVPPGSLAMSTGAPDGAYHRFALRFREILARDGITLDLKPSAGSVENLARLPMPTGTPAK